MFWPQVDPISDITIAILGESETQIPSSKYEVEMSYQCIEFSDEICSDNHDCFHKEECGNFYHFMTNDQYESWIVDDIKESMNC